MCQHIIFKHLLNYTYSDKKQIVLYEELRSLLLFLLVLKTKNV